MTDAADPDGRSPSLDGLRRLGDGYPGLESLGTDWFNESLSDESGQAPRLSRILELLDRLVDLDVMRRVTVVGCGPRPATVRLLAERGFAVTGIEPLAGAVELAREYLDGIGVVVEGSAESLPLEDGSQDIVFLESVLEHVDSPAATLGEAYRVLAPGGLAFIITTNRLAFTPSGSCAEFNVRFFNWLPALVKESYVHRQLHFEPELANYAPRPAVHWFTFDSLCELGRMAGFAHFYSHVDVLRESDPEIQRSGFKRRVIGLVQSSPWLRAAALTQVGGLILMRKRPPNALDLRA